MILLSSIGLTPPALFGDKGAFIEDTGQGAILKQLINVAVFALSLLLFFTARQQRPSKLLFGTLLIALGWCWLSLNWAAFPDVAIRRLVALTITMVVASSLILVLTPRSALHYLAALFAALLIINTLAVLLLPGATSLKADFDTWSGDSGTWRGFHLQKNVAGAVGAFGVLLFVYRAVTEVPGSWARLRWIALALFGIFFVYKTGSKTSFGLIFIASAVGFLVTAISGTPTRQKLIVLFGIITLATLPILLPGTLTGFGSFVDSLGQDPRAYTGRSQIWEALSRYVQAHFMLGSGYGSFWRVGENGPMYQYARDWLLTVPQAHNGYLDMLLQTGIVGLLIDVISAIIVPLYIVMGRSDLPREMRWLLTSVILFFVFHNMLETSLYDRDNPFWFLLLCSIAIIGSRPLGAIRPRRV